MLRFIREEWVLFMAAALLVFLLSAVVWASIESAIRWDQFVIDHNCKVVEKVPGRSSTGMGLMPNGKMGLVTMQESSKTAYDCDDGVRYWR